MEYNIFKEELKNRLTWKSLSGQEKRPSFSIDKYIKENGIFNCNFRSAAGFFDASVIEARKYSVWCKSKHPTLTEEELDDLIKFFIGTIGEIFVYYIPICRPTLYIKEKKSNFIFSDLHFNDNDYGVDLYGKVTVKKKTYNCVFQCKFWSPRSDRKITSDILSKAHSDAIEHNYIKQKENDNIFIFWLGDESHVSQWFKDNPASRHAVFIDKEVLDYNFSDTEIWKKLREELNNLGNLN